MSEIEQAALVVASESEDRPRSCLGIGLILAVLLAIPAAVLVAWIFVYIIKGLSILALIFAALLA